MHRHVSIWALAVLAMALGLLLFYIFLPFLSALFFAAVVALLAHPLHEKITPFVGGRRVAAAMVSVLLLLVCLVPLTVILVITGQEAMQFSQAMDESDWRSMQPAERVTTAVKTVFPSAEWSEIRSSFAEALRSTTQEIFKRTQAFLSDILSFTVAMAVMGLSTYYFLADGPEMLKQAKQLSPLEGNEENQLFNQFASVCRGLVLGTLVCAFAQAILLTFGLWLAGVGHFWMLGSLTFLFAMIPYVGSAGVWLPVTGWLLWQGRYGTATFIGIYGAAIVSTSDNLIRAHVLHGAAQIHPLIALISALGGIKLVGLWGIFLGPVVAAISLALLHILHERVESERLFEK